jgi:hypothetical protein
MNKFERRTGKLTGNVAHKMKSKTEHLSGRKRETHSNICETGVSYIKIRRNNEENMLIHTGLSTEKWGRFGSLF